MFKKFLLGGIPSHLLAVLVFLIISFLYATPILEGKRLSLHDTMQATASAKEVNDFHKATGEWAWWTNSMFGGMPSYLIAGGYPNSLPSHIGGFLSSALPVPINVFFLLMLGMYILLISLKADVWQAIFGAIAYAFGTYNLLFTEAGHISKLLALAYAPAVLAGFVLVFRGKYLLGGAVTALFLSLEIYANHLQITYYLFMFLGVYVAFKTYVYVKHSNFQGILKSYGILAVASVIALASHSMRLWNNYDYSKESTRGKSELTLGNIKTPSDGLDRDYAFDANYSYGILESLNILVPSFMGGASGGGLTKSSETYKTLVRVGVDDANATQFASQLPLYFGPQGSTSGPAYSGAIIVFLFILGLFIIKDRFRFVLLGIALFYLMMAWGANFSGLNYFLFDYFPYINKFRAVNMLMTLVHFCLVLGAVLCIKDIVSRKLTFNDVKKPLIYTLSLIFGVLVIGYFMLDFRSLGDEELKKQLVQAFGDNKDAAQQVINSLISDRSSAVLSDMLRSLIFILLTAAAIWAYTSSKIKITIFNGALIALIIFDLLVVDKRYFNNQDYLPKYQIDETLAPSVANEQILKDTDPDFRVVNTTTNFWSDARDSYYHKSIGGYHGAKLKRIQELREHALTTKDGNFNMPIFDMLNTKYFITAGQDGNLTAQKNPNALGNAWVVSSVKMVKNADEEMKSIESFNPRQVAVIDQRYEDLLKRKNTNGDTLSVIKLTDYKPNDLTYESNANKEGVGVFSEIFYKGNQDWKSFIDGKETPHFRVNYVLRGMVIPAGKHKIEFKFAPKSVAIGSKIDLFASIALVLFIAGAIFLEAKQKQV